MRTPALVLAALLLSGCAAQGGPDALGQDAATPTVTTGSSRSALDLVGRWTVTGPDVGPATSLYVADEIAVFQDCGVLDASWQADGPEGLFVASSSSGDSSCFRSGGPASVGWLAAATRFEVEGEERTLLGADGRLLARLSPGPRVTPGPNRLDVYAAPPTASPRLRARATDPAPLPAGEQAPSAQELARRWVPVGAEATKAFLAFDPDGTYRGSDGCNGAGGRYALGGRGRLLATTGPSTLIGCDGAPVGGWVHAAARAGLRDGRLVLHDADGGVVGQLAPG